MSLSEMTKRVATDMSYVHNILLILYVDIVQNSKYFKNYYEELELLLTYHTDCIYSKYTFHELYYQGK